MNGKTINVRFMVVSIIVVFSLSSAPIRAGAQSGDEVDPAIAEPHLRFEHITMDDGLSHVTVNSWRQSRNWEPLMRPLIIFGDKLFQQPR